MRMRIVGAALMALHLGCGSNAPPTSPTPPPPITPSGMEVEPLRAAATSSGKLVGAAVPSSLLGDSRYADVLSRHFNYLTAEYEMKWGAIEATRGQNDFSAGDAIVAFGQSRGMQIKGHALLWHNSVPGWVPSLAADELRTAVESHIRSVADHFRGRVRAWDVVNEAIADSGAGLRDTVFRQKLGDRYIADAFRVARQADPQALLFYNDYGGEGLNQKSDRIYELAQSLRALGLLDGVGLQMHVSASNRPSDASIAANMARLVNLGLLVNISEMDVRIRDLPGTLASRLDAQKSVYHAVVGLCVSEARCDGVTFWGFTDVHSWIDAQFGADDPLLFDEQYGAKPAYYGVLEALQRR
jgi:endo-1,4-beta-xylanase